MLEKQLDEMKNRISGRSSSFYPYITNKLGRISQRKLVQFINELLDGPQKYGRGYILFDLILIFNQLIDKSSAIIIPLCVKLPCRA